MEFAHEIKMLSKKFGFDNQEALKIAHKKLHPGDMQEYTVLTEEKPSIHEIKLMFSQIGQDIGDKTNADIEPVFVDDKFKGSWSISGLDIKIYIMLFKGKTAAVDYLLFKGPPHEHIDGNAGNALCILESTKTSNKESRNTAVNQRITKFTTYFSMYPKSKAIPTMFWLNSSWDLSRAQTATAIFGFRLMSTLGIRLIINKGSGFIDIVKKLNLRPFKTGDEIVKAKNDVKQKKGNISVRINHTNILEKSVYEISIKLDKGRGEHAGKVSHDPNVGLLCGLLKAIHKLENDAWFGIKNHNINQKYFDKKPTSKLWYSIHGLNVVFEDIKIKNLPNLPPKYFKLETKMTEKLATLLCDMISKNDTIFSNHGGCALTNVKCADGKVVSVGRKMARPDIMFANLVEKSILVIEGKVEKDLYKGCKQLSKEHLKDFIQMTKSAWPDFQIKKGLCITIDNIANINKYDSLEYPILFAVDNNGNYLDRR